MTFHELIMIGHRPKQNRNMPVQGLDEAGRGRR